MSTSAEIMVAFGLVFVAMGAIGIALNQTPDATPEAEDSARVGAAPGATEAGVEALDAEDEAGGAF